MAASEHKALEAFASCCNKASKGFPWLVFKEVVSVDHAFSTSLRSDYSFTQTKITQVDINDNNEC